MASMFDPDQLEDIFSELEDEGLQERMTEWERRFVADVSTRHADGEILQPGTLNKLKEIWDRMP